MIDANIEVRLKNDGTGIDFANVKMSMNPFDEIAVEQAVRLKEAGLASEVVAVWRLHPDPHECLSDSVKQTD